MNREAEQARAGGIPLPPACLYVDADACPVKAEIYRVAERFSILVVLVANKAMRFPDEPWIRLVLVETTGDAADKWIVDDARPGDVVVTNDILLAERLLKEKNAIPITPSGRVYTRENIGEALARRELMSRLREWGGPESGPPPFSKGDRSRFLQVLHETIVRLRREHPAG